MKRLTTDTPDGNYQNLHNMTLIKDREAYLRDWGGKGDRSLMDVCSEECKRKCDIDMGTDVEEFGEAIMECDCFISYFYAIAIGHTELRATLKTYEDTGLTPEEVTELKEECKSFKNMSPEDMGEYLAGM